MGDREGSISGRGKDTEGNEREGMVMETERVIGEGGGHVKEGGGHGR